MGDGRKRLKRKSYMNTRFFDMKEKKTLVYDRVSVEKKGGSKYEN